MEAFAKRFEGTLAPLPGARSPNTLALDFSRVQLLGGKGKDSKTPPTAAATTPMLAPGELKLVNAVLRPGARLHLISVAASHLALRFTQAAAEEGAAASSLLVFERTAAPPSTTKHATKKGVAAVAAPATGAAPAVAAPQPPAAAAAAVKKAAAVGGAKKQAQAQQTPTPKPRFKKPAKGTKSNPYNSVWEYFEEEAVPLYLVLVFPTLSKHVRAVIRFGLVWFGK